MSDQDGHQYHYGATSYPTPTSGQGSVPPSPMFPPPTHALSRTGDIAVNVDRSSFLHPTARPSQDPENFHLFQAFGMKGEHQRHRSSTPVGMGSDTPDRFPPPYKSTSMLQQSSDLPRGHDPSAEETTDIKPMFQHALDPTSSHPPDRPSPTLSNKSSSEDLGSPSTLAPEPALISGPGPGSSDLVQSSPSLRSGPQEGSMAIVAQPNTQNAIRTIAYKALEIELLQHRIGCTIVRALDLVQDLATVEKEKEMLGRQLQKNGFLALSQHMEIKDITQRFRTSSRSSFRNNRSPSTQSLTNHTDASLQSLGIDFHLHPSRLEGIVAKYRKPRDPGERHTFFCVNVMIYH
ncbi:hypothetical protein FA13DRAFT_1799706 [Coprinellus micaceus]|uniref:Uncharacterized protein n=1 Tax=Coprinellus micaceus TaxID=71717 RepID=A0A4Y7SII6_COPMI|nr:hypothetical protein FA13DRAFT_1799706 [Coprinellus micaceus]